MPPETTPYNRTIAFVWRGAIFVVCATLTLDLFHFYGDVGPLERPIGVTIARALGAGIGGAFLGALAGAVTKPKP